MPTKPRNKNVNVRKSVKKVIFLVKFRVEFKLFSRGTKMSHAIYMISKGILGNILACVEGAGAFRLLSWAHIGTGVHKCALCKGSQNLL